MADLHVAPQLKWRSPASQAKSALEASRNCACAGSAGLINAYGDPNLLTKQVSHHDVRLAAGDPRKADGTPRGLSTSEAMAAMAKWGVNATRYFAAPIDIARDALMAGLAVAVCIHYPTINNGWPELSGQLNFAGEHFLVLKGWRERRRRTVSYDSLYDGRTRTWGTAPLGPQVAPFRAYRAAMEDFRVLRNGVLVPVGEGLGVFIVVAPYVAPVPEPEPVPEPQPEPQPEPVPAPLPEA